jgi:hypothetical protein
MDFRIVDLPIKSCIFPLKNVIYPETMMRDEESLHGRPPGMDGIYWP